MPTCVGESARRQPLIGTDRSRKIPQTHNTRDTHKKAQDQPKQGELPVRRATGWVLPTKASYRSPFLEGMRGYVLAPKILLRDDPPTPNRVCPCERGYSRGKEKKQWAGRESSGESTKGVRGRGRPLADRERDSQTEQRVRWRGTAAGGRTHGWRG